jgi:hypothetical protein
MILFCLIEAELAGAFGKDGEDILGGLARQAI